MLYDAFLVAECLPNLRASYPPMYCLAVGMAMYSGLFMNQVDGMCWRPSGTRRWPLGC
jgi:hypothetical protein